MEEKTEKKDREKEESREKVEEKKEEISENKSLNKQVKWVVLTSLIIVIGTLFSLWIVEESKKFDFGGLSFHEEMFGNIKLYVSNIEGQDISGNNIKFSFVLRNDPRKLDIPINANINFLSSGEKVVSLNLTSGIDNCDNSSIASFSLGYFLNNLGIKPITAFTDKKTAEEKEGLYVDCETNPGNTVIILTAGNKTEINQDLKNPDCYTLVFNNCEVMQVVERFEMAVLAQPAGEEI